MIAVGQCNRTVMLGFLPLKGDYCRLGSLHPRRTLNQAFERQNSDILAVWISSVHSCTISCATII